MTQSKGSAQHSKVKNRRSQKRRYVPHRLLAILLFLAAGVLLIIRYASDRIASVSIVITIIIRLITVGGRLIASVILPCRACRKSLTGVASQRRTAVGIRGRAFRFSRAAMACLNLNLCFRLAGYVFLLCRGFVHLNGGRMLYVAVFHLRTVFTFRVIVIFKFVHHKYLRKSVSRNDLFYISLVQTTLYTEDMKKL